MRRAAASAAMMALRAANAATVASDAPAPIEAELDIVHSGPYARVSGGGGTTAGDQSFGVVSDEGVYSCWLLIVRHTSSRRSAAVLAALRKLWPPGREGVERMAFASIGRTSVFSSERAEEDERLKSAVLEAFEAWRPAVMPPEPRRLLVARCESLSWPLEACLAALPLRPTCHPLLAQACDAVGELTRLGGEADGATLRAHVTSAMARLRECLLRAAALREQPIWRHRLSTRLAFELSQRSDLRELLRPAVPATAEGAAALRTAGAQVVDGFGGANRQAKAAEVVAAEAFAAAVTDVAPASAADAEEVAGADMWGGGLSTLLRLCAHARCAGAVRRALGSLLDYLLHLTPLSDLCPTDDLGLGDLGDLGGLGGVNACLQPLCGGVGLAAHLDLLGCLVSTSNTIVELSGLSAADELPAPRRATSAGGYEVLPYCCNLEVLSLMLRDGYVKRRGGKWHRHFLDAALAGCDASDTAEQAVVRLILEGRAQGSAQ